MKREVIEKRVFFIIIIGALFFVNGCSSNPSVKSAQRVIEQEYKDEGYAKIMDVQKINGWKNDVMGQRIYTMQCKIKFEYLEDVCVYGLYGIVQKSYIPKRGSCNKYLNGIAGPMLEGEKKKGDKFTITKNIEFTRTEKGWVGPNGVIY